MRAEGNGFRNRQRQASAFRRHPRPGVCPCDRTAILSWPPCKRRRAGTVWGEPAGRCGGERRLREFRFSPMALAKGGGPVAGHLASHARGERPILAAEAVGRLDGTLRLILALAGRISPIAPTSLRCWSIAAPAGRAQVRLSCTRLKVSPAGWVTRCSPWTPSAGSAASGSTTRLGWTRFGAVPGCAIRADGREREGCDLLPQLSRQPSSST